MSAPAVAVLDYGSGNIRSAVRMLEWLGANVVLATDMKTCLAADGLLVPGVGNFHSCMMGLAKVHGPRIIETRLAGGRPVLGICVGMQVMFDGSTEPAVRREQGLGEWPGTAERLPAAIVPHMGWNTVDVAAGSPLFAGVQNERFYFVHSYAVQQWSLEVSGVFERVAPKVSWSQHGSRFVAAVENGPLVATQFHPEKSGDAGAHLLDNWLASLR